MPREWLVLLLAMLCSSSTSAATSTPAPKMTTDDKTRAPEVSIELLEFLGNWETATGPWNETIPDSDRASPARRPKEKTRD